MQEEECFVPDRFCGSHDESVRDLSGSMTCTHWAKANTQAQSTTHYSINLSFEQLFLEKHVDLK